MLYADFISFFDLKNSEKLMKIVNIDGENFHIFWTILFVSLILIWLCNSSA